MRKKIAPNDIHRRLLNVYKDQTLDVSTARRWVARFSSGDSDVKDKPRSGRPCISVTPRNEERLDQLIRANRRITTRELCTELNIGCNALEAMVATLGYRKVCARWVPPIPVWIPWSTLPIMGGLSYHTHCIVRIWPLLIPICSGRWKMDCVGNIFLATTPSYELWNSGPPQLVQIFTSAACRLLFIAGESA